VPQSEGTLLTSDLEGNLRMQSTASPESFFNRMVIAIGLLGGALLVCVAGMVTYEVLMRYFFNAPTTWVMEISIYFSLAGIFLSLAFVLKGKAHVRVDFVINRLPPRTTISLEIITSLLAIVYCGVMAWEGMKLVLNSFRLGEVSPTILKVPMFIPQVFIPVGSTLLGVSFVKYIRDLFSHLADGKGKDAAESSGGSQMAICGGFAVLLVFSLFLLGVSMNLGLLVLFFVLLFSGIPVSIALGLFGMFGFYFLFGGPRMLSQLPVMAYSTMDNYVMVALPLFILTSTILNRGEVGVRIYRFANVLVRHLPGGLGIASIIFCGLFAAMTGSSVAVAAAVSLIALPEMLARGYPRTLTIGLLAAGGTLGILFPPSVAMILYASMTNESLGSLFMAGLIPGLILSLGFCAYVAFVGGRNKEIQRDRRATLGEILQATRDASGGLITILIIIGGIYSGIFTPTESGGVASIYSLVLCALVYRSFNAQGIRSILLDTARVSGMILFIIIGANITGQVILMSQISQKILLAVKSMELPGWVIILSINVFLIIAGGPLEAISILVITLPILYPLVTGLGFSGLWFAVIMVINMELALISPPEGLNLFVLQNLAKSNAAEVSRSVIPFLVIIGLFLVLISSVPALTTWLPQVLGP